MTDTLKSASLFIDSLATAARDVVAQIAGRAVAVEPVAADASAFSFEVPFLFAGALTGGFALRFAEPSIAIAASLLTGEGPGENPAAIDENREAALELCRQVCGNLAATLRVRFGSLEVRHDAACASIAADLNVAALRVEAGERAFTFQVVVTEDLRRSLQQNEARLTNTQSRSDDSLANDSIQNGKMIDAKQTALLRDSNLGLLLDLALPVTLRFGSRVMLLKEVMELTAGSVVELDRRVREPVDLLIENKLIARGEVVLVEGNYGLRVLEVANERERLACLP